MFFITEMNDRHGKENNMLVSDIDKIIAGELGVRREQVAKAIELLDDGNTVPFIARYRKEATGSLEDEQLRTLAERLDYLRGLAKRQEEITQKIDEQGKLTPELRAAIERATKLQELEDLYLPYKQKRRTRAQMAREKGLGPLADAMMAQEAQSGTPLSAAAAFVDAEKGVETAEDALAGARDIVAEVVSEDAKLRQQLRKKLWQTGTLQTELTSDKDGQAARGRADVPDVRGLQRAHPHAAVAPRARHQPRRKERLPARQGRL